MSTRNFFDQRLLLPGFSFVTVLILLNPELIFFTFFKGTNVDVGNIIVSILAVPALGFLLSQPWFFLYQRIITPERVWGKRWNEIREKFSLTNNTNQFEKLKISDWFFHYHLPNLIIRRTDKNINSEPIRLYLERRWDLFSTMGSTISAIFSAIFIDKHIKLFLILIPLNNNELSSKINLSNYYDLIYFIFGFILISLISGMFWIRAEIISISNALINESDLKIEHLTKVFPKLMHAPEVDWSFLIILLLFAMLFFIQRDTIVQFPRVSEGEIYLVKYGELFVTIVVTVVYLIARTSRFIIELTSNLSKEQNPQS